MSSHSIESSTEDDTGDTQSYDETSSSSTGRSSRFSSCSSRTSSAMLRVINQINICNSSDVHFGPTFITNTRICTVDPNDNVVDSDKPPEIVPNCKLQYKFLGRVQELLGSTLEDVKTKKRCDCKRFIKKYWHWIVLLAIAVILLTLLILFLRRERLGEHNFNSNTPVTTQASTPPLIPSNHALSVLTNSPVTIQPTTALPSTTSTTTDAPPVTYVLVNRTTWGGRSMGSRNTREDVRTIAIVINITDSSSCDTLDQCKTVLHQLDNDAAVSLNFNFMMDSNGTMYEARGWSHMADEDYASNDIIKIGFIGGDLQLNSKQTNALRNFIASEKKHFSPYLSIKPQCCRDMVNEAEAGYGLRQICDLYRAGFSNIDEECVMNAVGCGLGWYSKLPLAYTRGFFCDSPLSNVWT